jgi:4-amino-4-deoxy-L-arabinose transferase-like glycosyltransferase
MLWTCVLGAGTIVVIALAGRRIGGARCGLIAAAIAALYPNIWLHDGQLLSETMAIFVTALIVLLSYRYLAQRRLLDAILLGGACGLAALARSELVLLVVLLVVPLALRGPAPWRARLVRAGAGCIAAGVVISPWIIYNEGRFKKPVLLSTQFGNTIAAANCDDTFYGPNIGSKSYGCSRYYDLMVQEQSTVDETEFDASLRPKVFDYIKHHKRQLPVVLAARVARTFELWRPRDDVADDQLYLLRERWVAESSLWTWYLAAGFAIYGFVVARRRRVSVFPLVMIGAATLLGIMATFAQTRYRAPLEVSVVLLAALAVDDLAGRRRRRRESAERPAHS